MESKNIHEDSSEDFPKGIPFDVPEGYFEQFPSRMAELIETKKHVKTVSLTRFLKPLPIISIAAMIAVISILGLKILTKNHEEVSDEELRNYVIQQGIMDEMELEEIIEYSALSSMDGHSMKSVSNKEEIEIIEGILLEEDIDMSELINEL
jgi:hypothetical protein